MLAEYLLLSMKLSQTDIDRMIKTGVWSNRCPVHHSRLTKLSIPLWGFDEKPHVGSLMVLDEFEDAVLKLFADLYTIRFPIERMEVIENYNGNDTSSMEMNNSSGYNGRRIMDSSQWSSHAYGLAIDLNPRQNPYLRFNREASNITVYPSRSLPFVNRNIPKPGMVEAIVPIFAKYGFTEWGGNWEFKPDYHHFQVPWNRIIEMFP